MTDTIVPVNAKVQCTDGHAGVVSAVILNPVRQEISDIVVKTSRDTDHVVSLYFVDRTEEDTIYLKCSVADLQDMPAFTETHYVKSFHPDYSIYMSGAYQSPYVTTLQSPEVPVEEEQIPPGELAVHRGADVEAQDGKVGVLEEFIVDEKSGKVTHLVLREGHLWGKRDVCIPVTAIDHTEANKLYLTLNKEAVQALPSKKITRHYHT